MSMHFFRVAWILDGSWYLTWLTSFVQLVLAVLWGLWFSLVYRMWSVLGLLVFGAAQVTAFVIAAVTINWLDAWSQVGAAFTALSVLGLTDVLAAAAVALAIGGFATMRRVTV